MAQLIKADGTTEDIENPTFDKIKELIGGGYVQIIPIGGGIVLAADEDGNMKGLPPNKEASELYDMTTSSIVGDVVVCKQKDLK